MRAKRNVVASVVAASAVTVLVTWGVLSDSPEAPAASPAVPTGGVPHAWGLGGAGESGADAATPYVGTGEASVPAPPADLVDCADGDAYFRGEPIVVRSPAYADMVAACAEAGYAVGSGAVQ